MEGDIIGAIKIKDGLFIGDEYAAKDLEFVITNKVTHVINCAGRQIANFWESIGVSYLTFNWIESDTQILFDAKDEVINEIFHFIEEAGRLGESVLVHSVRGQSRSCCVIAAYFMKRFNWTLYKTLEFLNSRRPDLEIRANFFHQLTNLESKLVKNSSSQISANWNDVVHAQDGDEILLRNTFINAKNAPFDEHLMNPNAKFIDFRQKLNWSDFLTHHRAQSAGKPDDRRKDKIKPIIRSILKGSKKLFRFESGEEVKEVPEPISKHEGKVGFNTSMKPNRSSKSLLEERPHENMPNKMNSTVGPSTKFIDLSDKAKNNKYNAMLRSSSSNAFDKEDGNQQSNISGMSDKNAGAIPEGKFEPKISNINGNIIHVTVNNYISPVNPLTDVNNVAKKGAITASQKPEPKKKTRDGSYDLSSKENNDELSYSNPSALRNSYNKDDRDDVDQNSLTYLANKQLKLALEKKSMRESSKIDVHDDEKERLSSIKNKEKMSSLDFDQFMKKVQPSKNREANSVSPMVRRGESPSIRKEDRQESESAYSKALTKSSITSTKSKNDATSHNYLNGLFPSSYLNSSYATTSNDKKSLQLKTSQPLTASSILRQTQPNTKQPSMQNYLSDSGTRDVKQAIAVNNSSANKTSGPFYLNVANEQLANSVKNSAPTHSNSFILGQKNAPVRATFDIMDRPKSANTRHAPIANNNTTNESFTKTKELSSYQVRPNTASHNLRSFSPTVKSSKDSRKESPSQGHTSAGRERQRSASPAQNITYNNLYLGSGPSKPRWKF